VLTIVCPTDGEIYHADEQHAGRNIKCTKCGGILPIKLAPVQPAVDRRPAPEYQQERRNTPRARASSYQPGKYTAVMLMAVALSMIGGLVRSLWNQPSPESSSKPAPRVVVPEYDPSAPPPSEPKVLSPEEFFGSGQTVTKKPAVRPSIRSAPAPQAEPRNPVREPIPDINDNRLKNGSEISAWEGPVGHGKLAIDNGTESDAAASLIDEETGVSRRFLYIMAHSVATMQSVGPCQCRLYFELGADWDGVTRDFRRPAAYSVFDKALVFEEDGKEVAVFSVTLNPVPQGNARTTRLSKEEFEKKVGRR
jgi:hypothetical protein